ncbi:MAG: hypothetical protein WB992_09745 [Bryobacteraceae bacterium]
MFRNKIIGVAAGLCGLLILIPSGWSQAAALQALQEYFTRNGSLCVVKLYGLHITSNVMGRPIEMRVQDGVVSRGASRWVHGDRDITIPLGQTVQFQRVEAAQDAKSDLLRVYVLAMGSVVPVSFVVPKNSLATMSAEQMQALVETVFQPAASAQPAEGNTPPSAHQNASPARPAVTRPNPPSPDQSSERTPLPSENVVDLEGILRKHNGDAILKIEGVHAVMQSPDFTRDNVIVDGVFQPRSTGGIYRGMRDMVFWPNSHVTFMQLAAFTDNDHDILHLVVRSDLGAFAPISFLFPKGELSSMSKRDIMKTMDPFIVFAAADENTFRNEPGSRTDAKTAAGIPSAPGEATTLEGLSLRPSRPPDQGCMWVPYVSKKWSLALLREHCTGGRNDWKLNDMADGIGMSTEGPAQGADIQILSKPATQPIETAIQQQVIAKLHDPAARANCRATRQTEEEEPGWHEYQVQAFGAYAKRQPKTPEEMGKDGMEFCGGLYGADVSDVFLYNPDVSKTHFFALHGLSDPPKAQPFDIFSLRFLNGSANNQSASDR